MAAYKTADLFIQSLLIIILAFLFLFSGERGGKFLFSMIFGGIQVISVVLHLMIGRQPWKSPLRRIHLVLAVILVIIVSVALLVPSLSGEAGLGILIYVAIPAMVLALFYTMITYMEWKKMQRQFH